MKVYIVTFDGYKGGYGSEIWLLGIYSTREAADKAADEVKEKFTSIVDVNEVVLDHTYDIILDEWGSLNSKIYLGGYIE
jgi:hypothetical protein